MSLDDGEARFLAGEQRISVPKDFVEVLLPSKPADDASDQMAGIGLPKPVVAPPAEASEESTRAARREAIRRYPGIGVAGSPENVRFVAKVKELRAAGSVEYFQDPDWPFHLVETIAHQEGWHRQDIQGDDDAAAPAITTPRQRKIRLPTSR